KKARLSSPGCRAKGCVVAMARTTGVHCPHTIVVRRPWLEVFQLGEDQPWRRLLSRPSQGALRAVVAIGAVLDEELRGLPQGIDTAIDLCRDTRDPARLSGQDRRLSGCR